MARRNARGFTLGQYLMLVDYTSRLVRDGKAAVLAVVAPPTPRNLAREITVAPFFFSVRVQR